MRGLIPRDPLAAPAEEFWTPTGTGRRPALWVAILVAGVVLAAAGLTAVRSPETLASSDTGTLPTGFAAPPDLQAVDVATVERVQQPALGSSAGPSPDAVATSVPVEASPQVAEPVAVRIPSIGVQASVIPLGLTEGRSLEVPQEFAQAGWWQGGPEPGEDGPAVIVGHVDSYRGPAVFFDLAQLQPGDPIHVDRADGTEVVFTVTSSLEVSKDGFPTERVFGDTDGATLRLVTCSGPFSNGSYEENLVVFAAVAD